MYVVRISFKVSTNLFFDKSLSLQTAVLENWFQLLSRNSYCNLPYNTRLTSGWVGSIQLAELSKFRSLPLCPVFADTYWVVVLLLPRIDLRGHVSKGLSFIK